ncbi:spore cortex-lytic enzyme [Candidatus Arthromitus sp. SFB-mouse-Japan]|uniref:peptidoglycan-binding protein n=1 Tax=unclassified Candidatus Neoarthromitus TaxID=2638829 RepID=UPI00021B819A|nr:MULTISPECIES: peptidoglycan-binding protein [unclassified Candidatus Arthromitus]EIA24767.1 Spore cortex-lytic enzyme [Candidatus Arthromitus sp. SFB-1]EIA27663.1 Spore cortex-lytic enzyme [Candidatus Arthromitus sp. SFB-co]EIA29720.1 Spore cortex-lytic enzyme [Candidatus Arthromitus sp. SFB-mouse-SU]AID45502.1 Spore cortex-lytic enzyme SleC [Candidatus Arthromitus sp. SFB-mouse-NL]EGX28093.1 peptidoglycan binding domain-containing protein [Candidatus Arthromitus sp. SFB-mouse-NYU]
MSTGSLKIQTYMGNNPEPVSNANIKVTLYDQNNIVREVVDLKTNDSGIAILDGIVTPPIELSLNEYETERPYGLCDVAVSKDGFIETFVKGCQLFGDEESIQPINLNLVNRNKSLYSQIEEINIEANTLYGNYPPKIPEAEEKTMMQSTGQVVLSEVVVPEFITVHIGSPNSNGNDYTVRYSEYIKNVASCEIYSTWPSNAIRANIYAIISFTLNRVYTEWYRGKGKDFTITNSTAYDHAFNYGRNIFKNISNIVDEIFSTYMKRPGSKQPLLSQYCDGKKVKCPGWMTQWGSKYLADEGYTPYEILTNFYGTNLDLVTAKEVKGIPISYPGIALKVGSRGSDVRNIQKYLNTISKNYPAIPKVSEDGIYGNATRDAVKKFQEIFNVNVSGVVEYDTWYAISNVYVAVTEMAELRYDTKVLRNFIPYSPIDKVSPIRY